MYHMGAVFWLQVPYGAWVRGGSYFASSFSDGKELDLPMVSIATHGGRQAL